MSNSNNSNGGPQIFGGLQAGKILKSDRIGDLVATELKDIDLSDVDCSTSLAVDVSFDIASAPADGRLLLYRKSMIMRREGMEPVRFGLLEILSDTDTARMFNFASVNTGFKCGVTVAIPTGFESFGLTHDFVDGDDEEILITNLVYIVRIVDQPITRIHRE